MDMDMDQVQDNASISQNNSQNNQNEGGDQENNQQEASKMQLMTDRPAGSEEILIEGKVTNEEEATRAIQGWMQDPENREFVAKYTYLG